MSCLYKILGVAKSAHKEEIKRAYQKLAFQFHPDKHTNSPPQTRAAALEKFKQIQNAYEILYDDIKRANYNATQREQNHYSDQYRRSYNHTKSSAGAAQSQSRQSYNHTNSSAGGAQSQSRKSYNHTNSSAQGQGQTESPSAAPTRRSNTLGRRAAAAALKFLRHVCVEFIRFTVRIVVEVIVEVVLRLMLRIMLHILVEVLKAILQPSSTKKVEDEKKKK